MRSNLFKKSQLIGLSFLIAGAGMPLHSYADGLVCADVFAKQPVDTNPATSPYSPFYYIRQAQQQAGSGYLSGNESTADMVAAFSVFQEDYLDGRNFSMYDDPSTILRLMNHKKYVEYKVANPTRSPMELYGFEIYRGWKRADDWLAAIPVGQLKLTEDLFHKISSLSSEGLEAFGLSVDLPDIHGVLPDHEGTFKKWPNFSRDPLKTPLTESEYQEIKKNEWLHGFLEVPGSKPGARKGVIVYCLPQNVRSNLAKITKLYEDNKDTMDPIELAVRIQRAFVSTHPFVDGNGRTSRLLMDRILLEKGLPPPVYIEHDADITISLEEQVAKTRAAVADAYNLLRDTVSQRATARPYVQVSTIGMSSEPEAMELAQKFNALTHFKFNVGGTRFTLDTNGFFYDQYEVPHEYHDGKFYPITDRLLEYYDIGGDVAGAPAPVPGDRSSLSTYQRGTSPIKMALWKNNIQIMEQINDGTVTPETLKVGDYNEIAKANSHGKSYIYPYQIDSFIKAMAVKDEPNQFKLANSNVQQMGYYYSLNMQEQRLTQVIGQYEYEDENLAQLQESAAPYPKLVAAIRVKRADMHKAARSMIESYFTDLAALPPAEKEAAEKYYAFKVVENYMKISKLQYKTFDDAVEAGADKYVPLMRSANKTGSSMGFIPGQTWADFVKKIPGHAKMIEKLKATLKEMQTDEGKKRLEDLYKNAVWMKPEQKTAAVQKIVGKVPDLQNVLNAAENGIFWDFRTQLPVSLKDRRAQFRFEHRATGDDRESLGQSFSTSPDLYTSGWTFGEGRDEDKAVYFVKAPRNKAALSYTSGFSSEYEVVGYKPIFKNSIVATLGMDGAHDGFDEAAHPQAAAFLKKYIKASLASNNYYGQPAAAPAPTPAPARKGILDTIKGFFHKKGAAPAPAAPAQAAPAPTAPPAAGSSIIEEPEMTPPPPPPPAPAVDGAVG